MTKSMPCQKCITAGLWCGLWLVLAALPTNAVRLAAAEKSAAGSAALGRATAGAPQRIEVRPAEVTLETPRRQMHLVVSGFYGQDHWQDLTRAAKFTSSDPAVVRIEGTIARPVANGSARITVEAGGQQTVVPVRVSGQEQKEAVSFHYGTLAALTKQGCNQGTCHGSPSGKAGFRLSLRAYDPALDAETLVHETFNRRTNLLEPEKSLLLEKPLMEVNHGGGRRLTKADASYALLRDWIAEGCRLDGADAPRCERIEVFPRTRALRRSADTQQLLVLAHFSDGSLRDVTSLADFSSSDDSVATVDGGGLVVGHDRGEAAILVRYLEKMETASLTFLEEIPGFQWPNPPENNYVDHFVFEKLKRLQIMPSSLANDGEFIRRAYLDVIGVLPTVAETTRFLAHTDPAKRAKLIDVLLDRPEYAEFWALRWGDLLRLRASKMSANGMHKFHRWLVRAMQSNLPYDQFARTLLTAQGSTYADPPTNFYRTAADTNECTEVASQLFLGIRIQCAKCHNHPFERWTQDNYYGIGAFFDRVQRKIIGVRTNIDVPHREMVVWVAPSGEITQPRTGKQVAPWLPLVGEMALPGEGDRRLFYADWLTQPDNPFFAKVGVNRIWGHLLGRGIVEPVDDFRDSNPPASAELLDALARDFVRHGFDQKHVVRTILNSHTYQLGSRENLSNRHDVKYFSHAATRLLTAEQLLDAICQVTGVEEQFAGMPRGMRATQLPGPDVDHAFLKIFGQPARETTCQCERSTDSNLSQAMQLVNGPLVHAKVADAGNRLRQMAAAGKTHAQIVRELYVAALCRPPSDAELESSLGHVAAAGEPMRGLEDVCWALLNTTQFLSQH